MPDLVFTYGQVHKNRAVELQKAGTTEEPSLATPGPASCQYDVLYAAGAHFFPLANKVPFALLSWEDVIRYGPDTIVTCGHESCKPPKKRCPGCQRKIPLCSFRYRRNKEE